MVDSERYKMVLDLVGNDEELALQLFVDLAHKFRWLTAVLTPEDVIAEYGAEGCATAWQNRKHIESEMTEEGWKATVKQLNREKNDGSGDG